MIVLLLIVSLLSPIISLTILVLICLSLFDAASLSPLSFRYPPWLPVERGGRVAASPFYMGNCFLFSRTFMGLSILTNYIKICILTIPAFYHELTDYLSLIKNNNILIT